MVEIKNIRIWNGGIYADCYKECDSRQYFELIIEEETYRIMHPSGKPDIYACQATNKLKEILESGERIPNSVCAVWCWDEIVL